MPPVVSIVGRSKSGKTSLIEKLVAELKLDVKGESIIINMVNDGLNPLVSQELDKLGIEAATTIPEDEEVRLCDLEARPLLELPDTAKAVKAINSLMASLLQQVPIS